MIGQRQGDAEQQCTRHEFIATTVIATIILFIQRFYRLMRAKEVTVCNDTIGIWDKKNR